MPSLFHAFKSDELDSKKAGFSPRPLVCPVPSAGLLR